jgi:hypothetical protein
MVPWMKDRMGSRWVTEPTDEESCRASLLGLQGEDGRFGSSSLEAWEEAEERLLGKEE